MYYNLTLIAVNRLELTLKTCNENNCGQRIGPIFIEYARRTAEHTREGVKTI